MPYIKLTNSKKLFRVDKQDVKFCKQFDWTFCGSGRGKFVGRVIWDAKTKNALHIPLHRILTNTQNIHGHKLVVMFLNNNRYDLRRKNLVVSTQSDAQVKKGKRRGNYSSQYIGVSYNKRMNKWLARCFYKHRRYHCGFFSTELEAALARDAMGIQVCGQYFHRNF